MIHFHLHLFLLHLWEQQFFPFLHFLPFFKHCTAGLEVVLLVGSDVGLLLRFGEVRIGELVGTTVVGEVLGDGVGELLGEGVGELVGPWVGELLGDGVGELVGTTVVGELLGDEVGELEGPGVGELLGDGVGGLVGTDVGELLGDGVGSKVWSKLPRSTSSRLL